MAEVLQQVSDALVAMVEAASPGVVRVEGRRRFPATGIVWSTEGLIVTAHHVVEQHDALHGGGILTPWPLMAAFRITVTR